MQDSEKIRYFESNKAFLSIDFTKLQCWVCTCFGSSSDKKHQCFDSQTHLASISMNEFTSDFVTAPHIGEESMRK